jgi:hypothetical protein
MVGLLLKGRNLSLQSRLWTSFSDLVRVDQKIAILKVPLGLVLLVDDPWLGISGPSVLLV